MAEVAQDLLQLVGDIYIGEVDGVDFLSEIPHTQKSRFQDLTGINIMNGAPASRQRLVMPPPDTVWGRQYLERLKMAFPLAEEILRCYGNSAQLRNCVVREMYPDGLPARLREVVVQRYFYAT